VSWPSFLRYLRTATATVPIRRYHDDICIAVDVSERAVTLVRLICCYHIGMVPGIIYRILEGPRDVLFTFEVLKCSASDDTYSDLMPR